MSLGALCRATVSQLQASLSLDGNSVSLGFDGSPNPICGEQYVSVWPGYWRTIPTEGLAEEYGVNVTVSRRLGVVPNDRFADKIWSSSPSPQPSMESLIRTIITAIFLDEAADALMNAANVIIGAGANGLIEPFERCDPGLPMYKGPEWWSAEGDGGVAGVAWTLAFGGAKRYQRIDGPMT